jgi:hemolysin activation/secretion protein
VLRAGRAPGQVDVVLNVDDNLPLHASYEVNDRSTADTSRTRASGTIGYDYLFGRPQSLSLQYQTAPEAPNEVQVLALTWVKRLPESGGAWAVYAIDSKSDVAAVGTLNVLGNGRIFGFRRILPGPSSATAGIGVSLGADFKDFKEDIRLPKDVSSVTPIRYLVSSAAVNGYLRKDAWAFDAGATLSMGFRGLVNREEDFAYKRAYGHAQFAYLRANGAVAYTLPKDFRVALRLAGQYSPQPLISNEQFRLIHGPFLDRNAHGSGHLDDAGPGDSLQDVLIDAGGDQNPIANQEEIHATGFAHLAPAVEQQGLLEAAFDRFCLGQGAGDVGPTDLAA